MRTTFIASPTVYSFTQYSGTLEEFATDLQADWSLRRVLENPDVPGQAMVFTSDTTVVYVNPTDWFGYGLYGQNEVRANDAMLGYNRAYTEITPPSQP